MGRSYPTIIKVPATVTAELGKMVIWNLWDHALLNTVQANSPWNLPPGPLPRLCKNISSWLVFEDATVCSTYDAGQSANRPIGQSCVAQQIQWPLKSFLPATLDFFVSLGKVRKAHWWERLRNQTTSSISMWEITSSLTPTWPNISGFCPMTTTLPNQFLVTQCLMECLPIISLG